MIECQDSAGNIRGALVYKDDLKLDAINAAFKLAHANGIAGYAIETFDGWIAAERKPSMRFGKVIECQVDGSQRHA